MTSAHAETIINAKHFTGAKPHTYQGNLWHLHPSIVKRLVQVPNWVNWRWELNEKGDTWTKVPYQPRNPTRKAETDNKQTWGAHAEAVANVEAGLADGIGFVLLETNVCAFDIDNCVDLASGSIDPFALELVKRCGPTYVETTVSGTGLRIIGLGGSEYVNRKQKIAGSKVSIESYRWCGRYITVSGMTLDGVKPNMPDLGNIDAVITAVVEELDHQNDAKSADTQNHQARENDPFGFRLEVTLHPDLAHLVRDGVPITEDRSEAFFHAVRWLKEEGWSLDGIIKLLERYPDGIGSKYGARLAGEVRRAFDKPKRNGSAGTDYSGFTGTASAGSTPPLIKAEPYAWTDPADIPLRNWVYGRLLIREFVTATVAPGGLGKSSLITAETLAMVSGKDLLGNNTPKDQLRVWLWNLEDPKAEIQRKLQAAAKHYGLTAEDIGDRLFVNSGQDQPLVIATMNRNGAVIMEPVVDALVAEIIARQIDVLTVDPFVSCHTVPENDNTAQDMVVIEMQETIVSQWFLLIDHFGRMLYN